MYALKRTIEASSLALEIGRAEFEAAMEAQHNLVRALEIEHKFDLLVRNYEELEGEFLKISLRTAIYSEHDWDIGIDMLQEMNRRLINVLTGARLYLDQVPHDLTQIFGKGSGALESFHAARKAAYSSRFGYRVCEMLRNYIQHRGIPCRRILRRSSKVQQTEQTRAHVRVFVNMVLNREILKDDPKVKQEVIAELQKREEHPDLKPLVREYLEGLGELHVLARELLAESIVSWEHTVDDAISRYRSHAGDEEVSGLALVELDGERIVTKQDLTGDMNVRGRRSALVKKNKSTSHFGNVVAMNY